MLRACNGIANERDTDVVVLDVETLDCFALGLWNEPIISYSLAFLDTTDLEGGNFRIEGCISESVEEEGLLLATLGGKLASHPQVLLVGHNISHSFKYIKAWNRGYDIPKIIKRSSVHGLDLSFLESMKVFDLMDVAFQYYDHTTHNLTWNGEKQRILKSEFIEEQLRIIRPTGFQKMGHEVRQIYENYVRTGNRSILQRILLYNCCDVAVESVIFKIFHHLLNKCRKGTISFGARCQHIPDATVIGSLPAWTRLSIPSVT